MYSISAAMNPESPGPLYITDVTAGCFAESIINLDDITHIPFLEKAIKLNEKNPDSTIIVSGGKGENETISESEAMFNFLISNGINENKVVKESESTSTYENLTYSEILIQERNDCYSVCIISNNYHIFRIRMIVNRLGLTANFVGVKTDWKTIPVCFLREFTAILKDAIRIKE